MKQCPNCKNTYTDETLFFCLADGAQLVSLTEMDKTVSMPGSEETVAFDRNPVRVDVPGNSAPESVPTIVSPLLQPTPVAARKGVSFGVVSVLVGLLLIVILGFVVFAGYIFLKPASNENVANATPNSSKKPENNAGKDENEDLKGKLANLEKKMENRDKPGGNTSTTLPTPAQTGAATVARANSPRDGFVALRTDPGTEIGSRITTIPHGATVQVSGCRDFSYVGKTRGRWCQVSYGGQTGWAFDGFLIY